MVGFSEISKMKPRIDFKVRPTDGPLQVYLDSSDYSVLSDAMLESSHRLNSVFQELYSFVDQGLIEIRFSAVHVLEIAHLDEDSKKYALRRARCLQLMSEGKCFRCWPEIISTECRNILDERPVYDGVYMDEGRWHPDLAGIADKVRSKVLQEFRSAIDASAENRQQRKILKRTYLRKGRLSNQGRKWLSKDRERLLKELSDEFPLSDRFYEEDLFLGFLAGQVSEREIVDEVSIVFRDVEKFMDWTYGKRDPDKKLVSWLRALGSRMNCHIVETRDMLDSVIKGRKLTSRMVSEVSNTLYRRSMKLRAECLRKIWRETASTGAKDLHTVSRWRTVLESPLGAIPTLDAYSVALHDYLLRNVRTDRKPKASDSADILHLVHLPYCDVFRVDGETAYVAKNLANAYDTVLVDNIQALPTLIDSTLQARR